MSSVTYGFTISLLLIASSWIWLQFDLKQPLQEPKESFWGQIYERNNQVYIKTDRQSFWQIARIRTLLSSKKIQIQSQNAAFLSILLENKGRLEIGENSKAVIHAVENTKKQFICEVEITRGDTYISFFGQKKHTCHLMWKGRRIAQVKNADMTLNSTLSELHIYVHRGQVTFSSSGRNHQLHKDTWAKVKSDDIHFFENHFSILTPFANDRVHQSQKSRTRFKWTNTLENSKMQLFVGTQRNKLRPVWRRVLSSDRNEGYFRFPLGTHYWQLVAKHNKKQYKSQIYKIFIKSDVRPVLVSPSLGLTRFISSGNEEKYKFVWLNQSRLENLFIEISQDPDFSTILLKRPAGEFGFIEFLDIFPQGKYFWRVSGFRHNSSELLASLIRHFIVTDKNSQFQKIRSWPRDKEKINRWDLHWREAKFVWDAFLGFQNIRINIMNLNSQFVQHLPVAVTANRIDIPLLDLGIYEWKLQGQSDKNVWIDITESKKIEVVSTPLIYWQENQDKTLHWTVGPSNTDHYMIRVRRYHLNASPRSSKIIIKKVRNNFWIIPSTFTDFFSVKIMAMDHNNQIIAISPEKDFILQN